MADPAKPMSDPFDININAQTLQSVTPTARAHAFLDSVFRGRSTATPI
jgi:hypothetical protein